MPTYTNNVEYSEGWDAAKAGLDRKECPYCDDAKREAWMDGWGDRSIKRIPGINVLRYIENRFREVKPKPDDVPRGT